MSLITAEVIVTVVFMSVPALGSLDAVSGPAVSIQTELALEQLQQKHDQELQELRIQLETQVMGPVRHHRRRQYREDSTV